MDRDIDLAGLALMLVRHGRIVLACTLVGLIAATIYLLRSGGGYEAAVGLLITRPPYQAALEPRVATTLDPYISQAKAYVTQAKSPDVEIEVQRVLGDRLVDAERQPGGLLDKVSVDVSREDSNLIYLRVRDAEPRHAEQVVAAWSLAVIRHADQRLNPYVVAQQGLEVQIREAAQRLAQKEDELRAFREQTGLGPVGREGDRGTTSPGSSSVVVQAPTNPSDLGPLGPQGRLLASRTADLAALKTQVGQVQIVLAQARALQAANADLGVLLGDLQQLGLVERGASRVPEARAIVAALEARDRAQADSIGRLEVEVRQLQEAVGRARVRAEQLEFERDLARDAYSALSKKLEEAKVNRASWSALRPYGEAYARPVARQPVVLGIGLGVGLLFGVLAALLVEFYDLARERARAAPRAPVERPVPGRA